MVVGISSKKGSSSSSSWFFKNKKRLSSSWNFRLKYLFSSAFKWKSLSTIRVSLVDGVVFRLVSAFEAVLLVLTLCFFYLCCGCNF
ncbi:hypothetical protein HN51_038201 [Arachis hypogaea]|uniref:Uncharacterized protein n=1 Tax=Arachis hypogaea TaxID=3818 RepID=A0A444ZSZ1_ARAHY|nr:uncharacterized protein DS421_13g435850 [Arachis hypogaea]RYR17305.1 hypothetical protein Ahy_B03g062075 [Arachis hypogaea]